MTIVHSSKPVIILVPGAWHLPDAWHKVKHRLEAVGFEVYTPKLLTAAKPETPDCTWRVDVAVIHDLAIPLFNQGRQAVIVGHSYGGIVATVSVEGQTVADRQSRGLLGGFSAVVYLCAFAFPQPGLSLLSMLGGTYGMDWIDAAEPFTKPSRPIKVKPQLTPFYSDLPLDEATKWIEKLQYQSQRSFEEPSAFCASDIKIPMTYLVCEGDRALPVQAQESMANAIPGMKIRRCSAGHSPFLSQPDFTTEVITSAAGQT
ncbi:Alpha/beta hydrolase fold-1 [Nemania sp. FL0031]|nr:Alpha/beta hydrolase fold-1 [Nemania sp. FL0031]